MQRHRVSAAVIVARSLLLANYLGPCVNKHAASAQHTMYLRLRSMLHYLRARLATARLDLASCSMPQPANPSNVCGLAQIQQHAECDLYDIT